MEYDSELMDNISFSAHRIDTEDNIYITGRSDTLGAGGQDMILLRYNTTGDLKWSKTWGYSGDERGYDVILDSDKALYVSCFSSSTNISYFILSVTYNTQSNSFKSIYRYFHHLILHL